MAFVKLDCGILNSTLWVERESRDIFITALLMAQPFEVKEPMEQLEVGEIKPTGFVVPPGWYGFVEAAGPGIVRRALADMKDGMEALRKLGEPDSESRSSEFDGRRLVRVNGGYIVLNYMKYRDKDATSAVRSARYRERKKMAELSRDSVAVTRDSSRGVTIAEAKAEAKAEAEEIEAGTLSAVGDRSAAAPRKRSATATGNRGTRLPQGWQLPKPLGDWAVSELGMSPAAVRDEAAKFRDYWHAKAGKDATKADWSATWRVWCRKAIEQQPASRAASRPAAAPARTEAERNAEVRRLLGLDAMGLDVIEGDGHAR